MINVQSTVDRDTVVIIPTYNERDNLQKLVQAVLAISQGIDVLIIDDASPDGTGDIADEMAEANSRIHVLHRSEKLGLGTAYIAGFRFALAAPYKYIVQMDADFSHRPEDLPGLLAAAQHADLVVGSRNVDGGKIENWSRVRTAVSRGGSIYARAILGLPIHDCTSGFKCFQRRVLDTLDLDGIRANGYAFQVEVNYLVHAAGFRVVETPIVFPNRTAGTSKMTGKIALEAAVLVWRLRRGRRSSVPAATPATIAPRTEP